VSDRRDQPAHREAVVQWLGAEQIKKEGGTAGQTTDGARF
jgi:hypothetical protein